MNSLYRCVEVDGMLFYNDNTREKDKYKEFDHEYQDILYMNYQDRIIQLTEQYEQASCLIIDFINKGFDVRDLEIFQKWCKKKIEEVHEQLWA